MVAGTAYSIETCYDHEQSLQHQPDHATAWTNLCVVPGTAYGNEASYDQALRTSPPLRVLGTILVSKAAA